ncbi:MAG: hypothetical protein UV70_C0008G0040, partial [Parcubacteria group bacterium GW2011_GWA2_43_13]
FSLIFFVIIMALVGGYVYVTTRPGSRVFYRDQQSQQQSIQEPDSKDTAQSVLSALSVALVEQNESGEFGSAEFTDDQQQTKLMLVVAGETQGERQALLHKGMCDQPGDTVQLLAKLESGISETVLPISLEELLSQLPMSVVVQDPSHTTVACGELVQ